MIKKIEIILILIFLISAGGFIYKNAKKPGYEDILSFKTEVSVTPTPLRLPNGIITEKEYAGKQYLILTVRIPENSLISLIPNFSEKISGEELIKTNDCEMGINGGFYLAEEKPLGLFIYSGKLLGNQVKSNIANAFVWSEANNRINFGRNIPETSHELNFIFQTGPLIIPGNYKLKLIRDDYARRSLLARDLPGNIYLLSITDKKSLVSGPKLADIPVIFQELTEEKKLTFEEMVNLDGGSASFFYSRDIWGELTFSSWSATGSILCIKGVN